MPQHAVHLKDSRLSTVFQKKAAQNQRIKEYVLKFCALVKSDTVTTKENLGQPNTYEEERLLKL